MELRVDMRNFIGNHIRPHVAEKFISGMCLIRS